MHDMQNDIVVCTRGDRCAFYHDDNDKRQIASNGCKINTNFDDNKSCKSGVSTQYTVPKRDSKRFAPFSPFEDVSQEGDVYQRKHARSDMHMKPLPSLSQPVAVGVSNHQNYGENLSNYSFNQDSQMPSQHFMQPQRNEMGYSISPPKRDIKRDSPPLNLQQDNFKGPIYNNNLFEGNSIPSRQHSYSENSAYVFNRQYNRSHTMQNPNQVNLGGRQNYQSQFTNPSPGYESYALDSTTPSSEMLGNQIPAHPEADPFKYLFNDGVGYERRADSLKYAPPPVLSGIKYRMEDRSEKSPSKSHNEFAEKLNEKLESKFIFTTQRKITEDHEELSQYSSEKGDSSQKKRSKMCKNSVGFVPKHLREAKKAKLSEEAFNPNINELVDTLVNSRRESKADDELAEENNEVEIAQTVLLEQNFNELIDN